MSDTSTDAKAKAEGDAGRQDQDQDGHKGGRRRRGKRREGAGPGDDHPQQPRREGEAAAGGERPREGGRREGGRPREGGGRRDGDRPREGGGRRDGDRRGGRDRKDRDHRDRRSEQPLTAGLFAGVADREMPCRVPGCTKTWTWFGTQQIRSLGKPPPKRMCAEHLAQFEGIGDRQVPCRNSWCTNTWLWTRAAQLFLREQLEGKDGSDPVEGKLRPPHRLCEQCFAEDKHTEDLQIKCKIPECENTWVWPRQAQLRHRAWVRRQQAKLDAEEREDDEPSRARADDGGDGGASTAAPAGEVEAAEAAEAQDERHADESRGEPQDEQHDHDEQHEHHEHHDDGEHHDDVSADAGESTEQHRDEHKGERKRKRRRKRKRKIHDGPPEKLCERCFERMGHLEPIEVPCKVHGCTNTWSWEREGQLRAWAAHDKQTEITELPQPPRRMCNACFEFVRAHGDREVPCGRPGCDKTWTYKTGAQLQDFLAGRTLEPIRLCEECSRSQFMVRSSAGVTLPEGAELMPCQVSGCEGNWVYVPGMALSPSDPDADEPPVDRMCDDCRDQRGAPGRDPRRVAPAGPAEVSAESAEDSAESAEDSAESAEDSAESADAMPDPEAGDPADG